MIAQVDFDVLEGSRNADEMALLVRGKQTQQAIVALAATPTAFIDSHACRAIHGRGERLR
jgi:hypothetical protein